MAHRDQPAREFMSASAVACNENATFEEIAELLADREISGMPVVDHRGTVVGVISERDLARAAGVHWFGSSSATRSAEVRSCERRERQPSALATPEI